jgi:hypothetical protein
MDVRRALNGVRLLQRLRATYNAEAEASQSRDHDDDKLEAPLEAARRLGAKILRCRLCNRSYVGNPDRYYTILPSPEAVDQDGAVACSLACARKHAAERNMTVWRTSPDKAFQMMPDDELEDES